MLVIISGLPVDMLCAEEGKTITSVLETTDILLGNERYSAKHNLGSLALSSLRRLFDSFYNLIGYKAEVDPG